jgi:hypothetical protein
MKRFSILACCVLLAGHLSVSADSDEQLGQSIIGVWWGEEGVGTPDYSYSEKTFNRDGTALGFIDSWPNGSRERTVFRSTWMIKDRKLISTVIFTNTPEFLPSDANIVDKIVSIGKEKMVLIADDGVELTRYRKSAK